MSSSVSTINIPVQCFLIDDDVDDQEIFSMALQEFNDSIHCSFADDGVKALEKLKVDQSFLPSCIFIDINMPRMNGVECLEQIKKIIRLKSVPVCMFSTSADPSIVAKTRDLGAVDFIVKPASISALSTLLSQFISTNVKPR
jgi:CheY-like chemotaxis protein